MYEPCGMKEIECLRHLVEDILPVPLGEYIFPDECEKINIHMLKYQVDISVILCPYDLLQLYYMGVGELHQKHYLSVCSLGIRRVIECIEIFLKCLYLTRLFICHLPDVPIGPTPDFLVDFEPRKNVRLYFFTH